MEGRRAVDQLIEIGERAGVTTISDRATLNRLLCPATGLDPNIERILTAFELDRNGFMILVSLLAADPKMVDGSALELAVALAERDLRRELGRLAACDLLSVAYGSHSRGSQVGLTDLGREIAVFATYRVLNAAVLLREECPTPRCV